MKRIVIIANKWWEADPLCAVLLHERARPAGFSNFSYPGFPASRIPRPPVGSPRPPDPSVRPRITFDLRGASVELWCLEELMNPAESGSSSMEKARVLPGLIAAGSEPALVVAFGTAGSREGVSANGCVVVGRRVFIHNPFGADSRRTGLWRPPHQNTVVESAFPVGALSRLDEQARFAAEARFLPMPLASARPPVSLVGNGFIALGVVNVTNYDDYSWADASATAAFNSAGARGQIGSIETTHGVIRESSDAPFLFVSAIVDEHGLFDWQVTPRVYSQNFVGSHNAAVSLLWMLPALAELV